MSPLTERALRTIKDPETGCASYDVQAFQECRQAYFLKQQNQILQKNQQTVSNTLDENAQLKIQMEGMRGELEMLKSQQVTQQAMTESDYKTQPASIGFFGSSFPWLYILFLVAAIVVTVFITKYLTKKL